MSATLTCGVAGAAGAAGAVGAAKADGWAGIACGCGITVDCVGIMPMPAVGHAMGAGAAKSLAPKLCTM